MDLSFIEAKTLFLIGHLFGIALGAGGAFIADLLFIKSIQDKKLSKTEVGFLSLASHSVTAGLIILIVSGLGLFSLDPERYLDSSKFLAKVTIVGIIVLNGFIFHFIHIPRLMRHAHGQASFPRHLSYRMLVLASGVVSVVSWMSAIVLGAIKSIPWDYGFIIGIYGALLVFGFAVAYLLRDHLMPRLRSS